MNTQQEPQQQQPQQQRELTDFGSENVYRLLVQGVTDYAIYLLHPDGEVANWNAGAQRFKGYTAQEIVGQHFSVFYSPAERAEGLPQRGLYLLQQLKAMGVTIDMDDFGNGYSSLETLRAFPFDKIKLDRSFISELETSQQARTFVRAMLALGHSLNVAVLAEGVETEAQRAILEHEGCHQAQGFLFGRPVLLDTLGAMKLLVPPQEEPRRA